LPEERETLPSRVPITVGMMNDGSQLPAYPILVYLRARTRGGVAWRADASRARRIR
jgi:hypothetical protein